MTRPDDPLSAAIAIAATAHRGQRYGGGPYILHPLRVMLQVEGMAKVVAVLHDMLEDTDTMAPSWLTTVELRALSLLTRDLTVPYEAYIADIATYPGIVGNVARAVKRADLRDNLTNNPTHRQRLKYLNALTILETESPEL